jgi:hypothetical protein
MNTHSQTVITGCAFGVCKNSLKTTKLQKLPPTHNNCLADTPTIQNPKIGQKLSFLSPHFLEGGYEELFP